MVVVNIHNVMYATNIHMFILFYLLCVLYTSFHCMSKHVYSVDRGYCGVESWEICWFLPARYGHVP